MRHITQLNESQIVVHSGDDITCSPAHLLREVIRQDDLGLTMLVEGLIEDLWERAYGSYPAYMEVRWKHLSGVIGFDKCGEETAKHTRKVYKAPHAS